MNHGKFLYFPGNLHMPIPIPNFQHFLKIFQNFFNFFPKMGSKMAIFGHFPIQILNFQQSGALWGVTALSWCAVLAKSENRSCSKNNLQQLSVTKFLLRRQS